MATRLEKVGSNKTLFIDGILYIATIIKIYDYCYFKVEVNNEN